MTSRTVGSRPCGWCSTPANSLPRFSETMRPRSANLAIRRAALGGTLWRRASAYQNEHRSFSRSSGGPSTTASRPSTRRSTTRRPGPPTSGSLASSCSRNRRPTWPGLAGFLEGFDPELRFPEYLDDPTKLPDSSQLCKTAGQTCYMSFGPRAHEERERRSVHRAFDLGGAWLLRRRNRGIDGDWMEEVARGSGG